LSVSNFQGGLLPVLVGLHLKRIGGRTTCAASVK
jgi:hypothetical protein